MRRIAIAASSMILLAACQPTSSAITDEQRAAVSDTVMQIVSTIAEAGSTVDFDLFLSLFDTNPVWAESGVVGGWDSTRTAWREVWDSFAEVDPVLGPPQIKVLAADAAVMTQPFEWSVTDVEGTDMVFAGAWTLVVARTAEGWKIVYGHESWLP